MERTRKGRPEDDALDVSEDMLQDRGVESKRMVFRVVMRGEEIETKVERQEITEHGALRVVKIITVPVAACGRKLKSYEDIAGFCSVCDQAECSEHAKYCEGFEGSPCQELLCGKHVLYAKNENGEKVPCCPKHYEMRFYFERNPKAF